MTTAQENSTPLQLEQRIEERTAALTAANAEPEAFDDALAQSRDTIAARGGSVEVAGPLPVVRGHRTTLAQLLANLVANALMFVAPGVAPHVVVRAPESYWTANEMPTSGVVGAHTGGERP